MLKQGAAPAVIHPVPQPHGGLLDAVHIDLVPILLGHGVRWFENLGKAPVQPGNPPVIEGHGVTHLAHEVVRKS